MRLKRQDCLLYAVTDTAWLRGQTLAQQVEAALAGGVTMVQLREKELTGEPLEQEAREILVLCRRYGVPLLINDDVLLAKKIGADGVHVGQSDMAAAEARRILGPDAVIGVTARTVEQARAAEAAGADYIGSGAVFGTSTKKDARPMDPAYFQQICESVSIPVTAIGGITLENIHQLRGRKMAGFAIVSGIFSAEDIEARTRQLWQAACGLCMEEAAELFSARIRNRRPVVQCITNIVTVNDCANALLAAGASPTMAHHPQEMEDFAEVSDALVCNMGATESLDAMLLAAAAAVKKEHPVVIDPVGCASSSFRREKCMDLVRMVRSAAVSPSGAAEEDLSSFREGRENSPFSQQDALRDGGSSGPGCGTHETGPECRKRAPVLCIRGNAAEIRALARHCNTGRGVDDPGALSEVLSGSGRTALPGADPAPAYTPVLRRERTAQPGTDPQQYGDAAALARETGAIVVQSGETDCVTDGRRIYEIRGGSPWMARVTGTGCMLSALMGAWLAAEPSALAAAACCRRMNACAEQAVARTRAEKGGTGTFHIRLLDALSGPIPPEQ